MTQSANTIAAAPAADTSPVLRVRGMVAGYTSADLILKGVDLDIGRDEIVCIIGPNGAGKSTFLKAVAGLLKPSAGTVSFQGAEIVGLPARQIARLGIAFVPQEANIFPTMSVRENLEMGAFTDPKNGRIRIDAQFDRFPVLAKKRRHAARTLSGGQRQMLAMAIALMVAPHLLLLDEPSAGLSPAAALQLFDTIRGIHADGVAIGLVEQNAAEALALSTRGYILVDGKNSRDGPADRLATDPDVKKLFLGG